MSSKIVKVPTFSIWDTVACPFPSDLATFVCDRPSYFILCFNEFTIEMVSRSSPGINRLINYLIDLLVYNIHVM